jgi:hypothetical protein
MENFLLKKSNFLIHFFFLFLALLGLSLLGYAIHVPFFPGGGGGGYLQWDAGWYYSIKMNGYQFNPAAQSNTGFFPLFPMIWKLSGLGPRGISILNLAFFTGGIFLLAWQFKIDKYILLFYLSLPAIFFNYIPYSEALFFFTASIFLVGFKRNSIWLIGIGLFLSSLARATAIFYIPTLLGLCIYYFSKDNFRRMLPKYGIYVLIVLIAFFLVIFYQWTITGKWFAYTFQQINFWDHGIRFPKFPLTDWYVIDNLWHDTFALGLSVIALILLGFAFFRRWFKKDLKVFEDDPASLFSVFFLTGLLFYVLLFHPDHDGTSLLSTSRYICCVPFTLILFNKLWVERIFSAQGMTYLAIGVIILLLVSIGLTNFYAKPINGTPFRSLEYFGFIGSYLFLFFYAFRNRNFPLLMGLYGIQLIFQLFELYRFTQGQWVG